VNRPNYLPPPQTAVIVGLSGGVDSAVAAIRLLEAGCRVAGLFMSNWDEDDAYCTSAADLQDARAVCNELGIVLHTVNFAAEYRSQVLPAGIPRVAFEAGQGMPWGRLIGCDGLFIGIEHFGASAPDKVLAEQFGFTAPQVAEKIAAFLKR
jgi:hypothetical protein